MATAQGVQVGHRDKPLTQEGRAALGQVPRSPSLVGVQVNKVLRGSCSWREKETRGVFNEQEHWAGGVGRWGRLMPLIWGQRQGSPKPQSLAGHHGVVCLVFVKTKESRNWQEHRNPPVGGHGPGVFLGKRAEERTCLRTHTQTHMYTHVHTRTHHGHTPTPTPAPPLHAHSPPAPPQPRRTSPAACRFPFGLFKPRGGGGTVTLIHDLFLFLILIKKGKSTDTFKAI